MAIKFLNTVQVDTDVLYVDTANDRVGIGTTSPDADLEVEGGDGVLISSGLNSYTAKLTLRSANGSYGGGGEVDVIGAPSDYMNYYLRLKNSPGTLEAFNSYVQAASGWAWDGNIRNLRSQPYTSYDFKSQGSSQMVIYNNNVGIGTTSPSGNLHVVGASGNSGRIYLSDKDNGEGGADALLLTKTGVNSYIYNRDSGDLRLGTNDQFSYVTIKPTGNIGIGTTNPSEKLVVRNGTSSTDVKILAFNNAVGTEATLRFSTIASETNYEKASIIARNAAGSFGRSDMHFALDSVADAGNVQFSDTKMTILNGGDVGIGTTSPSELLHLSSTGPARLLIEADTDNITETDNAQIILKQDGGAVVGNLGYKTNTNGLEITNNYAAVDGILTFGTRGTERMRVSDLGNVGMGATNLTTISAAVTTLSLGSTAASTSGGIAFQANGVVKAYNYVANNYLINQTVLGIGQIFYGAGSEQMRIHNTTGNVGIGTTSPLFKLDLGVNAVNLNTATNKQIVLNVNGGYTGQATDQYKVIGYTGSIASNTDIFTQTSGENLKNFYTGVFGGAFFNSSRWGIVQGGSTRFCVLGGTAANGAGNVGIGTTSPGAKLDVAGNIIVSGGVSNENDGVRVTNPGGASYISAGNVAGAIKITLPQIGINTMMRMEVKVYEYTTNESFTVQCGGYSTGTSQWFNEYAYIESSAKDDRNFTVRFGYDGSKSCIYIGELGSNWTYPQVFVTEFQGGFQNATALNYQDGWDISFEASAFQGVVKTQADTQINNWARSGTNTYYASSTGNVGIGTTTPYSKLQVASAGNDVPTAGNATGGLWVSNTNKTYGINMGVNGSGWGFIQSQRADGLTNLYSLNLQPLGGNVGIGTTSPGKLLEVSGGANEACLRLRDTASNYWDIQNTTNGKLDFSRGGTFRMRIDQNGSLSLVSSTALKGGGGSWGTYSDERVKKDVSNYTKGLNEILAIKPITYKYNGKANLTSEKQFVGIIAQEIKEVLPSTVEVTPTKLNDEDEFDTDLLTFDASELTFTLINAVKDLKAEIEELKKQINK